MPRASLLAVSKLHRRIIDAQKLLRRVRVRSLLPTSKPSPDRPRTRGDCVDGPRPCPWISCRYHLAIEVRNSGSIALHPDLDEDTIADDLERMPHTCALDVADEGPVTNVEIGELLGCSHQRAHQLVEEAAASVRDELR